MRVFWKLLARQDRRRGFTMVEIMVVVIIIGLIASLVGPRLFKQLDKAKIKTTRTQISSLETSVDLYRLDVGEFPPSLEALVSGSGEDWDGPYIKQIPLDPWGDTYQYNTSGDDYTISSSGGGKTAISSDD